jgi:hypothetical protein
MFDFDTLATKHLRPSYLYNDDFTRKTKRLHLTDTHTYTRITNKQNRVIASAFCSTLVLAETTLLAVSFLSSASLSDLSLAFSFAAGLSTPLYYLLEMTPKNFDALNQSENAEEKESALKDAFASSMMSLFAGGLFYLLNQDQLKSQINTLVLLAITAALGLYASISIGASERHHYIQPAAQEF